MRRSQVKVKNIKRLCSFKGEDVLRSKVALWRGDITRLEIDAIVNAANKSLLGGGGVDGAIHAAAGRKLLKECMELNGCETGEAKITKGYNLPAKHVIHTVGPIGENETLLSNCYKNSLDLMLRHNLKTVAFPCISTGIYGYPNEEAAKVALGTAKQWLQKYHGSVELVIFCLFLKTDVTIYEKLADEYFPTSNAKSLVHSPANVGSHNDNRSDFALGNVKSSDPEKAKPDLDLDCKKDALEGENQNSDIDKVEVAEGGDANGEKCSKKHDLERSSSDPSRGEVAKETQYGECEKENANVPTADNMTQSAQSDHLPPVQLTSGLSVGINTMSVVSDQTSTAEGIEEAVDESDGKKDCNTHQAGSADGSRDDMRLSEEVRQEWIKRFESSEVEGLGKILSEDTEPWAVGSLTGFPTLRLVGGLDISYHKEKPDVACVAFVILAFPGLETVYEDASIETVKVPYIPGYLGYREAGHFQEKIKRASEAGVTPQVIFVDGNGMLHPRKFGSAVQVGVASGIPTIGVAKNLLVIGEFGIYRDKQHNDKIARLSGKGGTFDLVTNGGLLLGKAVRTSDESKKPVYVSVGNKCSLETAVSVTLACSKVRVPEPIRQADYMSKTFLRKKFEKNNASTDSKR